MATKMAIPLFLSAVIAVWAIGNVESAAAPAPAVDCSTLVLNMADCLSFVINGSTVKKPEGTCCSGLKTVLKSDAECLCESFKNSAQLGVTLNITKASTLPTACHISAPSLSNCGLSLVAGGAPATSPALPPTSTTAGVPTSLPGASEHAPAPAPGTASDSASLTISFGSLLVALVAASFSSI